MIATKYPFINKTHLVPHAHAIHLLAWHGMLFSFELTSYRYGVYLYRACPLKCFDYQYWDNDGHYELVVHEVTAGQAYTLAGWAEYRVNFLERLSQGDSELTALVKSAVHVLNKQF